MNPPLATRIRSAIVWLRRERHGPALDRLFRGSRGLFVLAGLSFLAGWLLPDPATLRAFIHASRVPCIRIAWVARITTGVADEPGPILLVQTEWIRDAHEPASEDADSCRSSNVLLRLPPADESLYHRRDGGLVPLRELGDRPVPRIPVPSELCLPPAHRPGPDHCLEAT